MESFYGGLNGQSFSIKEKFTSKYQMDKDLSKGWTSPISVGEFVVVSYGLPSDPSYDDYKNEDLRYFNKSYNSTLWQKKYDENTEGRNANGLSYQLIASMTGNTPRVALNDTLVLDANQLPDVEWDNSDLDKLLLTFMLPQSQTISVNEPANVLDCDKDPAVNIIYPKKQDGITDNINKPILNFSLPQSQVIEQAVVSWINVEEEPQVSLDITDINRPVLKFSLPVAQSLKQGETLVLDADKEPSFNINFDDINNPIISFSLPQSQVMASPNTVVEGPEVKPSVALADDSTPNVPKLRFNLPRAVKFYYGDLLGERTAGKYTLQNDAFIDYQIGDYYINASTGFIYKVSNKIDNTTCTFDYIACIQSPLPGVVAIGVSPYTLNESGEYIPTIPVVTRTFTNAEETAWKLEFELPKTVKYTSEFEFIGIEEEGKIVSSIQDADTIKLNFKIPRGANLFAGIEISDTTTTTTINGARPGDVYLNNTTGLLYKLNSSKVWIKQEGLGLKGPVGDALNVVKSYTIQETADFTDSLDNGVKYIQDNYTEDITPEDIFAITWIELDTGSETSYWYFKSADNVWGRVQLTGGVMNLIESVYNPESSGEITNKTYSIHYINKLIGGDISSKDKDKTTYSATQIEELSSWGNFVDLIPTT